MLTIALLIKPFSEYEVDSINMMMYSYRQYTQL